MARGSSYTVSVFDVVSGACTSLAPMPKAAAAFRAGAVTADPATTGRFSYAIGCVIDKATRSLVVSELYANMIVRLRRVDV